MSMQLIGQHLCGVYVIEMFMSSTMYFPQTNKHILLSMIQLSLHNIDAMTNYLSMPWSQ